jgi:hypothetical protein
VVFIMSSLVSCRHGSTTSEGKRIDAVFDSDDGGAKPRQVLESLSY